MVIVIWTRSEPLLGKLVGETDERHKAKKIDPNTGKASDTGISIKPGHVHQALRKLAGIQESDVLKKAQLKETDEFPSLFA